MSRIHILAVVLLVVQGVSSAKLSGAEGSAVGDPTLNVQTKDVPGGEVPIIHRPSSLPTAWRNEGRLPKALASPAEKIQQAAHFDTTSTDKQRSSRRGVAQRLKDAQKSTVYVNQANPPGSKLPSTKSISTSPTATVPIAAPSNRPRIDVARRPAPTINSAAAPIGGVTQPTSTSTEIVSTAVEDNPSLTLAAPNEAGTNDSDSLPAEVDRSVEEVVPAPAEPAPDETIEPDPLAAEGAVVESMNPEPLEATHPQPVESMNPEPIEFAEPEPPIAIPNAEQKSIPSVMTRSALVHQLNPSSESTAVPTERMQLTPIGGERATRGGERMTLAATPAPEAQTPPLDEDSSSGDLLIENESPVLTVKTRGPKTISVGKTASYKIDIVNSSEHDAKDVVVDVNIPTWTDVSKQHASSGSARLQPDDRGNTVMQWSVGRLAARGRETLTLDIIPRGSRPFDLGVTWTFNPVHSMAQIQVQEPKLDISVVGPNDILFGETKIYTITVSNPGTGDAENVVLQLLPLMPGDPATGVRQLGVLKSGTRRAVEVELTARQPGRLQIRAEATADGGLNCRGHQEILVRRANLEIKVEGPPMKYAGTRARYTFDITNNGDAPAQDVVALATLPSEAKSITATDHGAVHEDQLQVQWDLGSLRPGTGRRFDVECVLNAAGTNRVDIRAVASGNLTAISATETNVESLADLKLSVNDPKGAIAVGTDVVYEVRITNRGTKDARDIQVVGYFSEGVEPVSISGWSGTVAEGQVELEPISRLGAGQEMVVTITAQANRPGNHVFRAQLDCNNPETRLAQEEWTRFYGDGGTIRQADRRSPDEPNAKPNGEPSNR